MICCGSQTNVTTRGKHLLVKLQGVKAMNLVIQISLNFPALLRYTPVACWLLALVTI